MTLTFNGNDKDIDKYSDNNDSGRDNISGNKNEYYDMTLTLTGTITFNDSE